MQRSNMRKVSMDQCSLHTSVHCIVCRMITLNHKTLKGNVYTDPLIGIFLQYNVILAKLVICHHHLLEHTFSYFLSPPTVSSCSNSSPTITTWIGETLIFPLWHLKRFGKQLIEIVLILWGLNNHYKAQMVGRGDSGGGGVVVVAWFLKTFWALWGL